MNSRQLKQGRIGEINPKIILVVASILAIALCIWGSNGVRGTDQYWYLSDTETLIKDQKPLSNITFPGTVIRNDRSGVKDNYIIHNGPLIHIHAIVGKHTGAYNSWILLNIALHIFIGLSIYLCTATLTSTRTASCVSALYLVSPIGLWQTVNLLQEQFFAGLMAAIALTWLHKDKNSRALEFLLAGLLAFGVLCHPIFFALALIYFAFRLIQSIRIYKNIQSTFLWIGIACLFFLLKQQTEIWFPSNFQPDLNAIITGSIPDKSNMIWHFSDLDTGVTVELLKSKVVAFFYHHFLHPAQLPFYLYTNLAMFLLIFTVYKTRLEHIRFLIPAILVFGLYVAITVLMQTQARYQQIIASIVFITIGLAVAQISSLKMKYIFIGLFTCNSLLGGFMMYKTRVQASNEERLVTLQRENLGILDQDARVVAYDYYQYIRLGYVLKPRSLLVVNSEFTPENDRNKAINLFAPTHIISDHMLDQQLSNVLKNSRQHVKSGEFFIYEIL